jgi:hypothetical protein
MELNHEGLLPSRSSLPTSPWNSSGLRSAHLMQQPPRSHHVSAASTTNERSGGRGPAPGLAKQSTHHLQWPAASRGSAHSPPRHSCPPAVLGVGPVQQRVGDDGVAAHLQLLVVEQARGQLQQLRVRAVVAQQLAHVPLVVLRRSALLGEGGGSRQVCRCVRKCSSGAAGPLHQRAAARRPSRRSHTRTHTVLLQGPAAPSCLGQPTSPSALYGSRPMSLSSRLSPRPSRLATKLCTTGPSC